MACPIRQSCKQNVAHVAEDPLIMHGGLFMGIIQLYTKLSKFAVTKLVQQLSKTKKVLVLMAIRIQNISKPMHGFIHDHSIWL